MDGLMDFGSSDSEGSNDDVDDTQIFSAEGQGQNGNSGHGYMDSDEEEQVQNAALLKIMASSMPHSKTKKEKDLEDFEAEMEAELDRRTLKIEAEGGVRHQVPITNLSLLCSSTSTSKPGPSSGSGNQGKPKSIVKSLEVSDNPDPKTRKTVSFAADNDQTANAVELEAKTSTEIPLEKQFYDDIYYDSDESVGETEDSKVVKREKRKVLSPDQLFYDPKADSKDQDWMNKRRVCTYAESNPTSSCNKESGLLSSKQHNLPASSDAVLNCPACFTVLCMDCQRHELYTGQYRAMFVMNCSVKKDQTVNVPMKPNQKRKRKLGGDLVGQDNPDVSLAGQKMSGDLFNPVHCKVCNTQVAMLDSDEVYHFYNILSSHS